MGGVDNQWSGDPEDRMCRNLLWDGLERVWAFKLDHLKIPPCRPVSDWSPAQTFDFLTYKIRM